MPSRIPSNLEQNEILWFALGCCCGFETATAGIGLAGIGETATEHVSYRVAWFDDRINELRDDDFPMPITMQCHQIEEWLETNVVPRIVEVNGNCFHAIPELPSQTSILCPMCDARKLIQYKSGDPELDFTLDQHGNDE